MEPEGSLLCLQEPGIGPCPKADESTAHIPFLFLSDPFYSDHVTKTKIFNVVSSTEVFRLKLCINFCSGLYMSCVLSSYLQQFNTEKYTDHEIIRNNLA